MEKNEKITQVEITVLFRTFYSLSVISIHILLPEL